MIWATVSSLSYFCWLYRASPSLAAKNIIKLISVLTIWWCPCVESSLMLLKEGFCCDQCILLAKLCWPFPCFICTPRPNLPVTLGISWLPTFALPSLWWREHLLCISSAKVFQVFVELFSPSFFGIAGWGCLSTLEKYFQVSVHWRFFILKSHLPINDCSCVPRAVLEVINLLSSLGGMRVSCHHSFIIEGMSHASVAWFCV